MNTFYANLPVNTGVGNNEKSEASLPVKSSLILEGICFVLGLVHLLGHGLGEDGHLGHELRLLGARVLHGGGGGGVARGHAPSIAGPGISDN